MAHDVGRALCDEVVWAADGEGLLSDEHFSVDGTLRRVGRRIVKPCRLVTWVVPFAWIWKWSGVLRHSRHDTIQMSQDQMGPAYRAVIHPGSASSLSGTSSNLCSRSGM